MASRFRFPPGLVQLVLVLLFLVGAVVISRVMVTSYRPPQAATGEAFTFAVSTVSARPQTERLTFHTTGTVEVPAEVNVVPQVSGRVISVHPDFLVGGTFGAGEILFEIDPRDFELEVERALADVARARTTLELEQANAAAARTEWAMLHGETPPPTLVAREPQLAEAQAGLKSAEALLATAELALERTRYALPAAGRVIESRLAPGQFISAGQSFGTVFYPRDLEVEASLGRDQQAWLESAAAVEVTIRSGTGLTQQTYAGRLARRAATIERQTRFAPVRFGFQNPPQALLPGAFVAVEVKGPEFANALRLPATAEQTDGTIWHLDAEDHLRRVDGAVVYRDAETLLLTGIARPLDVVTSRLSGITDGAQARRLPTSFAQAETQP